MVESTQKRSVEEIMAAARKKATSFVSGSTASDADAPAYAAAKAKEQVKATPKVATQTEEQEEVSVSQSAATQLHIKENQFYQIVADTQTSQEDKMQQIADAFDPKKQTMEKLRENYKAFQEYYSYIQSENLDAAVQGVERMIKDLEENKNIEVAKLLKALKGMLAEIGVSRELVEVMRVARTTYDKEGNSLTVEALTKALKRNDEIIADLAKLEKDKEAAAAAVTAAQSAVDDRIKVRDQAEGSFGHKLFSIIKKDTTYSDRVTAAETLKGQKEEVLAEVAAKIAALETERNKELEEKDGVLKILRSVDETGDNLSQRLIASGKHGIDTVRNGQKSVIELFHRVTNSEDAINDIGRRVADKQISLTVLQSGLMMASDKIDGFKQELEATAAPAVQEAEGLSILEQGKRKTASIVLGTKLDDVVDFQGRFNSTISEMQLTLAGNIDRKTKTENGKKIIDGTRKSVTILGRDGLNKIAENMESVLNSLIADQNDEMQQVVVEFAKAAGEMERGTAESMKRRSEEMHSKDMSYLDDTIQKLHESERLVADTLEQAVTEGMERADRQKLLRTASEKLESATSTMRDITGQMSAASLPGRPADRAETTTPAATTAPTPKVG
ncbi:MAG: hypothetical protein WCD70_06000 [Alphaproteobacteria bacterium]